MRTSARVLLCVAAVSLGAAIAARYVLGAYSLFGITVNVPLNAEGAFGALVTALLVWRAAAREERMEPKWAAAIALAAALVALFPAFGVGLLSDDFIIVETARHWSWTVFTTAGGDGFFRPLGYASWAIDALFAWNDPWPWHFTSWVLHAVNAALVARLAARLGAGRWGAGLAGVLFALHGSHLEAAVWVAGRFDVLATLFSLSALLWFGESTALALVFTLAALWSKEAAFVLPGWIALVAWRERRGWKSVVPFAAVTAAAFVYRWALLGGIGGYREASGESSFYALRLEPVAKIVFARLWTSLYFPINWSTEPSVWVAAACVLYVAALIWLAARAKTSSNVRVALGMLGLAILPALHLLGGAADLSGGRLLYLPSVFFCVLLGLACEGLPRKEMLAVMACVVVFHAAALAHDLPFWRSTSNKVEAICRDRGTPVNMIDGVPALRNGYEQCITRF